MKYSLLILISIILLSCASVVAPTGGPKDETPPIWNRALSTPDSINNTNFNSDEFVLHFNEPVDVKNLYQEIISNPNINKNLEYKIKKKSVQFKFIEPLDTNTTYLINFGNSIVDITESNPAKNIIVAFSTGSLIDSLQISGTILNNLSQRPLNNIIVALYPVSDTNDISKHKPKYYTKTTQFGTFQFKYIKNSKYIIRAFEDLNNNLLYDKYKENVGFADSNLILNKTITAVNFNLFREKKDTLYIKSIKRQDDHIAILFSQGLINYNTNSDNDELTTYYDQTNNTVKIFTLAQNPTFTISAIDSTGHKLDSTANVINFKPKQPKNVQLIKNTLNTDYQVLNNKFSTKIHFSSPLDSIIYDSLDVIHGTDSLTGPLNEFFSYNLDSINMNLNLVSKFKYRDSLRIIFKKGSLKNIYATTNKKTSLSFINKNPKKYGVLSGKITCHFKNYIFQLLLNDKVIEQHNNIVAFEFKDLNPGTYAFRIINDENNNGLYDTGNLGKLIQPETIYYHRTPIQLKANWEIIDLIINTKK